MIMIPAGVIYEIIVVENAYIICCKEETLVLVTTKKINFYV